MLCEKRHGTILRRTFATPTSPGSSGIARQAKLFINYNFELDGTVWIPARVDQILQYMRKPSSHFDVLCRMCDTRRGTGRRGGGTVPLRAQLLTGGGVGGGGRSMIVIALLHYRIRLNHSNPPRQDAQARSSSNSQKVPDQSELPNASPSQCYRCDTIAKYTSCIISRTA